jgi:AAA15 family ATPase/GTPase
MSKHFIKKIEIEKFKCFKNFEAEGFSRVNLITGKNNVGKTAFMEACFLLSNSFNIFKSHDSYSNNKGALGKFDRDWFHFILFTLLHFNFSIKSFNSSRTILFPVISM